MSDDEQQQEEESPRDKAVNAMCQKIPRNLSEEIVDSIIEAVKADLFDNLETAHGDRVIITSLDDYKENR